MAKKRPRVIWPFLGFPFVFLLCLLADDDAAALAGVIFLAGCFFKDLVLFLVVLLEGGSEGVAASPGVSASVGSSMVPAFSLYVSLVCVTAASSSSSTSTYSNDGMIAKEYYDKCSTISKITESKVCMV